MVTQCRRHLWFDNDDIYFVFSSYSPKTSDLCVLTTFGSCYDACKPLVHESSYNDVYGLEYADDCFLPKHKILERISNYVTGDCDLIEFVNAVLQG